MHKSLIVASTEFANAVRGKFFIISMLIMPIIMVGAGLLQKVSMDRVDAGERRFAIVDETGVVSEALRQAATAWNATVVDAKGKATGPRYLASAAGTSITEADRVRLSQDVRENRLYAFVEIPASVLQPDHPVAIRYYSNHPGQKDLPRWLQATVTAAVVNERFRQAAVDRATVEKLTRRVGIEELGLVERDAQGYVKPAEEVDEVRSVAVPAILMFLLFMPVMMITPQLINAVLEEKMSRISEVLLGSVKPFELMLGKLLGVGGVSVVLAFFYIGGAYGAATYFGYANVVKPMLLVEFGVFLALAMLLFGSMYLAIGSACSTIKDAQSLMMPVSLLAVLPMMLLGAIMKAPDGPLAVAMSFFPFSSPYIMLMRSAANPPAPMWQVGVALAITTATTVAFVWAGSRIFRTGLLMQGKAPTFVEMLKWVKA